MNTEQKKAAPAAKVLGISPGPGAYITTPVKSAAISYVHPDPSRRFLVISGRGPFDDDVTIIFALTHKPHCWIQVSELRGIVGPQDAVTSFLLSPRRSKTLIDELKLELAQAKAAYWKVFNEKQRLSKSPSKRTKRR